MLGDQVSEWGGPGQFLLLTRAAVHPSTLVSGERDGWLHGSEGWGELMRELRRFRAGQRMFWGVQKKMRGLSEQVFGC